MEQSLKKTVAISLGINLFVLSLCLIFGNLRFGALDDYFMARILEGAYGDGYDVHMVFVNVLYGYTLLPLYHLFPSVSWYYVGELIAIFLSFSVVGYVIICKLGVKWGPVFALSLSAAFASDYYLVTQFTQCASALSASGFLMLIYAMEQQSETVSRIKKLAPYIVGFLLVAWGSVMRWDAFLMGLPFLGLTLFVQINWCWKNKVKVLFSLLLLLVVALGVHKINAIHYESQEYKTFMDFQPYRVTIGDFDNYDVNAAYEDLDELELSSDDLIRLRGWFFYDKEKFSMEKLFPIVRIIQSHKNQKSFHFLLKCSLAEMARYIHYPISWPWIFVCVLLFFVNRRKSWYVWGSFVVCLMLMGYLFMISRNVYRVENGFFLYASMLGIPFLKKVFWSPKKLNIIFFFVLAVVYTMSYCVDSSVRDICTGNKRENKSKLEDYQKVLQFIDNAPDSLVFLVSMQPFMGLAEQKDYPYVSEPFGSWKKIISTGYWTPYFPAIEQIIREKNIQNPIKDAVRDNVYVIADKFDDYLQENYYDSVHVDVVEKFEKISIDKYSVVESGKRNE